MPPRSARGAPAPIGQRAERDHPQGEATPTLGGPRRRLRSRRVPTPRSRPTPRRRRSSATASPPSAAARRSCSTATAYGGAGDPAARGARPGDDRPAPCQRGRARLGLRGLARARRARARRATTGSLVDDGLSHNGTYVGGERVDGPPPAARRRRDRRSAPRRSRSARRPARPRWPTVTSLGPHVAELLTPAQRRVLVALCRPFREGTLATPATNQQIADELVVSVDAVKSNLRAAVRRVRRRRPPAEPEAREPRAEGAAQRRGQPAGAVMRVEPALGEARDPDARRRPPPTSYGFSGTSISSRTRPLRASTRLTVLEARLATHTEPPRTATPPGSDRPRRWPR